MSLEENKAIVRDYLDSARRHLRGEAEDMREFLTPDLVLHTPPQVSDGADHDERLHNEARTLVTALPDLDFEIEEMVAEGDLVVVHLAMAGTHDGTLDHPDGPVEASGARVEAGAMVMFRARDGKTAEHWYYSTLPDQIRAAASTA